MRGWTLGSCPISTAHVLCSLGNRVIRKLGKNGYFSHGAVLRTNWLNIKKITLDQASKSEAPSGSNRFLLSSPPRPHLPQEIRKAPSPPGEGGDVSACPGRCVEGHFF